MAYRVVLNLSRPEAELVRRLLNYCLLTSKDGNEEYFEYSEQDRERRAIESINRDIDKQIVIEKVRKQ